MRVETDRAEVSAPGTATGLSLSPDHLAIPLSVKDSAIVNAVAGPTRIYLRGGTGADGENTQGEAHPVVEGIRTTLDHYNAPQVGVQLHLQVGIPRGRGLGAKSAGLIMGIVAAHQLIETKPADGLVVELATKLGASPVRGLASYRGQPVLSVSRQQLELELSTNLQLVAFVPNFQAGPRIDLTDRPSYLELRNEAARAAAFVQALTTNADLEALLELSEDPFGLAATERSVPASVALIGWLRSQKVPAVLCGAGPAVLSLHDVAATVRSAAEKAGWRVLDVG